MWTRRWLGLGVGLVLAVVLALAVEQAVLWWGTRSPAEEAERLTVLAGIRPGLTVAEIGAGSGEMAGVIGAKVLPGGRFFVTELSDDALTDLRALVAEQRWTHAEVRQGEPNGTALPDACCDLIYMRHVYHHFEDRLAMAKALGRAVAPGGQVGVIDFAPQWSLNLIAPLAGGHGVTAEKVIGELSAAGFRLQHHEPRWTSSSFLVLFRADPRQ